MKRVLVVDDDANVRLLLARYLRKWGFEVLFAADGKEACVALSASDAPRLVLLDWQMPAMSGLDVCEWLRAKGDTGRYVLLLTGRGQVEDIHRALSAGADDVLQKPFNASDLQARVDAGWRAAERAATSFDARLEAPVLPSSATVAVGPRHEGQPIDAANDGGKGRRSMSGDSDACPEAASARAPGLPVKTAR